MAREDAREWEDAYFKEFKGIMDRKVVKVVKLPPGTKALGTTTRWKKDGQRRVHQAEGTHVRPT